MAAKNLIIQQQSFNRFIDQLNEKFNKKHLEILENNNNTSTDQNLIY
ncbi:6297_t:CDS:2 [Cetraspora pellucida]|uniref:6297_t:CDS:1 n=1 Tax=Cetraspora pellucida TaxID=1433469 RepID=A0ACA9LHC3_9GLOM|nr:6297_t:CDS:2 [Cetraspora pellucida]